MNTRERQIGFSQRVRLEWLERTANLVLAGSERQAIERALAELLADRVSVGGEAERGNREKVITILLKVWANVPRGSEAFRDEGLAILRRLEKPQRLAVHWGACLAAYPFFGAVASNVGRLLGLQGSAAATLVQRRIREQYGERDTVSRAARRILRSFIDWGVLVEGKQSGVYLAGPVRPVADERLAVWLVEAHVCGLNGRRTALQSIAESPAFFPLRLPTLRAEGLLSAARLDVARVNESETYVAVHGRPGIPVIPR
jgi:hypothetical protein